MIDQGARILKGIRAGSGFFLLAGFAGDLQILVHTISQNGVFARSDTVRDAWLICRYADPWPHIARDGGTFHNQIAAVALASARTGPSARAGWKRMPGSTDRLLIRKANESTGLFDVPEFGIGQCPR